MKTIKCEECKDRISKGKEKYINNKRVCQSCFNNIKINNKKKEEGMQKCKYPGCLKVINSKNPNKSGYCWSHWIKTHYNKNEKEI